MKIPEGFVLVPVEPTDEMIVAFCEAWYAKSQTIDDPDMIDAYMDMLSVALKPEIPEYDEAKERELFEAFAMERFLPITRANSRDYLYNDTEYAWAAWKACAQSRAQRGEV